MTILAEKVLALVNQAQCLSDRQLTDQLLGRDKHPSAINQSCRWLARKGLIERCQTNEGIRNFPVDGLPTMASHLRPLPPMVITDNNLQEDDFKRHLETWLDISGWQTEIAWAKKRGVDVEAVREGEIWRIEVKGCGSCAPMRVTYFQSMVGELLQRMDNENARYSIAMPNLPQFRGLWTRLPQLAKTRTGITALFVSADGTVEQLN